MTTGRVNDSIEPNSYISADTYYVAFDAPQNAVETLPTDTLGFLLGSRYCETDRLSDHAWQLFGNTPPGWARVQAICGEKRRAWTK